MTIIHPLDSLLEGLFPEAKEGGQKLIEAARRFYTVGPFEPAVQIKNNQLIVEINIARIEQQKGRYDKVLALCERGEFTQAKKDVEILIREAPQVSEYHRIYGQILSEEGDREGAINALIDALRWNPKNEFALLMMGNIFTTYRDDLETALKYYDEVLKIKPDDYLALNNIGANLMQHGKNKEAYAYFQRAVSINSEFPNAHYALALTAHRQGDNGAAFAGALVALQKNKQKGELYSNSFHLAIDAAGELVKNPVAKTLVETYGGELAEKYGKSIQVMEDASIPTAAKIEFAENYGRDHHLVKYKPGYPAVEHLVMHELVHLELAEQARAEENQQLYTAGQQHKNSFFFSLEKEAIRMRKQGVPEKNIAGYLNALFEGINRQIFNAPVDLFIEDILFNRYPELKPFQFLSLLSLLREGIEVVTKPEIVENMPIGILSKSKIFNLVNALHFKNLFDVDLIAQHKATRAESDQANALYA
ncbi:MAG: tetratricopeptide repeat protein, partial [Sphingobacteriaceae bacterium]